MGQQPTKNLDDAPVVIIVGAGAGGTECAKALDRICNVVLIDKTSYSLWNVAALRASVQPGFENRVVIPYDRILENGHFIVGQVVKITDKEVFLKGEDKPISFDYLIIATGSAYAFPFKVKKMDRDDLLMAFQILQGEINDAAEILIVGGGPVGIELAGEILDTHPKKSVTLIHSRKMLLDDGAPDKVREKLERELTSLGCKLVLGDRAKTEDIEELLHGPINYLKGKRTIKTESGKKFDAVLVFLATGARINCLSYVDSMPNSINKKNELIVNDHGQVLKDGETYYENIFSLGDCSSWGGKLAYFAHLQAPIVAKNIASHMKKDEMTASWTNPPMSKGSMIVPVGRSHGAGYLNGFTVGRRVTSMFKGKDLFVSDTWKAHGYKTVGEKGGPIRADTQRMVNLLSLSADQGRRLVDSVDVKVDDEKELIQL